MNAGGALRRVLLCGIALAGALALPAYAHDTVTYYYTNTLHSAAVETDAQGNVIERTYYAPYGQVLNRSMRDGPGYTGHEEDPATGLVYMQQRYYDPESGVFLSVDPVTADGNTGGNFNRYWYANDNPYRYTDPFGMCTGSHVQDCPTSPFVHVIFINPSHDSTTVILRHIVKVTTGEGVKGPARTSVVDKINAAAKDINQHAKQLTDFQKQIISNIKKISVSNKGQRGIFPKIGQLDLVTGSVLRSSPAFLAANIVHDGFHVFQLSPSGLGLDYNRGTASLLERNANDFEIRVGKVLGLTPYEMQWINTDHHTAYNDVH